MTLYPLDWVSGQLSYAAAVFAELIPAQRRQVFRIAGLPDSLIGYRGAIAFDFYNSRFRRLPRDRRATRYDGRLQALKADNSTITSPLLQNGGLVA